MNLIHYTLADQEPLPKTQPGLYEYMLAANGIYVRAKRPGLEAIIPIGWTMQEIRGLVKLAPFLWIEHVPARLTARMVELAYIADKHEVMFYLVPDPWQLITPDQVGSSAWVTYQAEAGAQALIEVHSHHRMKPFFSSTDNRDENGFRIYAVLGDLAGNPTLHARVGIYGHYYEFPARWAFHLPAGLWDSIDEEQATYDLGDNLSESVNEL